ncbi:MAG: hypothetical protein JXQ29_16425 [Planctomycetes bacterium]|nr:hypothetical protein [Planctomycetota bacterium]
MKAIARAPYVPASPYRSELERAYAHHLWARQAAQEIRAYSYEAIAFRLAWGVVKRARVYTPDFLVINGAGEVELHETKGSRNARGQKAALDRLDRAAAAYSFFRWLLVERGSRGEWQTTEIRRLEGAVVT